MNNDEFFLAELDVIKFSDIEAYNPNDFQRRFLQMLEEGVADHDHKLRTRLFCFAGDNNMIPRNEDGSAVQNVEIPFTLEHVDFVIQVRTSREHYGKMPEMFKDPLLKQLNPAFELSQDIFRVPYEEYYVQDLDRRWKVAGDACNWQGVIVVPGRKIALTDSPIWGKLGSPELFEDGLGFDTPPFYLNGGWLFGWETVSKDELDEITK